MSGLSEHEEQSLFVEWFRLKYRDIRIIAIPNGVRASINQAKKAKREGVSSGVPDLYIPKWKIWIEMKKVKGGSLSPTQKDWIEYLNSIGDTALVCKGCNEAILKLQDKIEELKLL